MTRNFTVMLCLAAGLIVSTSLRSANAVTFDVVAAYAPSGSPSASPGWNPYVQNALAALEFGLPSLGDRNVDPGAYQTVAGSISPLEMFYTNFNSWRGVADPNPVYYSLSPVFQTELGNRIHFGVHITDADTDFALQNLSWKLDSDDPNNYFDQQGTFASANYSNTRVGINYGIDGIKGTADDVIYDSGESGATLVNELIYVGVGDGFSALSGDGINNQDSINANLRDLLTQCPNCLIQLGGEYTLSVPGQTPIVASDTVAISIQAGMGGDYNYDRQITSADKDMLGKAIVAGTNDVLYDLNVDSLVNFDDLEIEVHDIANTYFGDANCDGQFNSTDLIDVMQAGLYETGSPAMWSTGDFNADGFADSSDLILALSDGGYEQGAKPAFAAVPEPASIVLTLIGLTIVALRHRRR